MEYKAHTIEHKWPKPARSFNQKLVKKRLQELAIAGIYFDSKVLP